MKLLTIAAISVLPFLSAPTPAQTKIGAPLADVRPSPARSYPFYFAVLLPDNRLVVRDATMVDLIATAYGVGAADVQGGPRWLERDRYDIVARLSAKASRDDQHQMLLDLLEQRFHLQATRSMVPMPAYVLTADHDKLRAADGTGDGACHGQPNAQPYFALSCRNVSLDELARTLHIYAGAVLNQPVVNSTDLTGTYDLDLKWTAHQPDLTAPGAISIFDALEQQLGLKLALATTPRKVLTVANVLREPTPNAPDLDKLLPAPPLPQFEVATIKPSKPDTHGEGRISGDGVNFKGITLKDLICLAWDLNEDKPALADAPKWLDQDRFDISAKVAAGTTGRPAGGDSNLPMDIYQVELMMRALLIERFQIKAHMEDRPIDSYELVAANPKLKPADPSVRTVCKEIPSGGRDPRMQNPVLNRLVSCRNMTMAELCAELQRIANGYIFNPIVDATGLTGAYDFTLSFTSASLLRGNAAASNGEASDPNGALSVFDAVDRQLGLKLLKRKRSLPALVIEHVERQPTEN